jgi:serine/threonine kinase 3
MSKSSTTSWRLDTSKKINPKEFEMLEKLGEGSYGEVWKSKHVPSGTVCAVKMVPIEEEEDFPELEKEVAILRECESEYIVQYYGSFRVDAKTKDEVNELWIVMEYCGAGSVADIMGICECTLDERQTAAVVYYTLTGLQYLHGERKIHRDIKVWKKKKKTEKKKIQHKHKLINLIQSINNPLFFPILSLNAIRPAIFC